MPARLSKYISVTSVGELILSGIHDNADIAVATHCTTHTIQRHRRILRVFGNISGLPNVGGRDPVLSKPIVAALIRHLFEKPDLYLDEMAWFIWDEFRMAVSRSTISRALNQAGWSKKQVK